MSIAENKESISQEQMDKLVDSIKEPHGFDYSNYSIASFRRRIQTVLSSEGLNNVDQLIESVTTDSNAFQRFVHGISVNVSAMFRDPSFYKLFRAEVVPLLATYPFIRVWIAGCASGEEVYSIAIVLQEEGLYDRCRIYSTDLDTISIDKGKSGIFPVSLMKDYSRNYIQAGGCHSLSRYYTAFQDHVIFNRRLKDNIVFAQHNLVCDNSFNEFHLILCRNVLIYFNETLRDRVLELFHESLVPFGVLGLGSKESLQFTRFNTFYKQIDRQERIYKKVM